MRLTIDDVVHLPELEFEDTRRIGKPIEWAEIAPVRDWDPKLVLFNVRNLILGVYRDRKSGKDYLVYFDGHKNTASPEVTRLDQIHEYKKIENYQE